MMEPTEWQGLGGWLPTDYGTDLGWGLMVALMCWLALVVACFALWRND